MRHALMPLGTLAALGLLACGAETGTGSDPEGGDAGPEVEATLAVVPAQGHTRASGPPLVFSAVLEGSEAPVTWALDGPGTIASGGHLQVVYTPPAEGSTQVIAELVARAGRLEARATITVGPLTGETVNGRFVAPMGLSAEGHKVMVLGGTPTVTEAEGRFTIRGVERPYDLAIAVQVPEQPPAGVVYRGLTRLDPVLGLELDSLLAGPRSPANGRVSGTVTGGAEPKPGTSTQVVFAGEGVRSGAARAGEDGAFELEVGWRGGESVTGTLHALQWQSDGALPTSYSGYGKKTELSLEAGGLVSGQSVALEPVAEVSFAGTVKGVSMLSLTFQVARRFELTFGDSSIPLGQQVVDVQNLSLESFLPETFSLPAPVVEGARMRVNVVAVKLASLPSGGISVGDVAVGVVSQGGLPVDAANASVTVPAPPSLVSPAKDATGVGSGTEFRWGTGAGVRALVLSTPGVVPIPGIDLGAPSAEPVPAYTVFTAGESTTVPDLSFLGMEWPRDARYGWRVAALPEVETVDDLATGDLASLRKEKMTVSLSAERRFQTAD